MDCPLLFWCLDPHLNAYWHSAYARLFDLVCSTQRAWIPAIAGQGAADVRWLPWFGQNLPQQPWGEREHGLAFVGRVTAHRPARKWMVEFLEERAAAYNPAIRQEVSFPEMMALYGRSRVIPNESIFGEVNFRLFEGASSGCLVLGQAIEEQADLFEPGREMDTYEHVVEFGEKLDKYLKNDRLTGVMARAAHARVLAEHLPEHRVRRIVEYARDATRNRATGKDGDKWTALAAGAMWEAGVSSIDVKSITDRLAGVRQDAEVLAATLRFQAAAGMDSVLEENVKALLVCPTLPHSTDLNLAASMAALRTGHFSGAKTFWYRHLEKRGNKVLPPSNPKELLMLWARELQRLGRGVRPGFGFDAKRHLPGVAVECLLMILAGEPEELPTLRLLDSLFRPVMGSEQARVGVLSILTLFERKDWRLALEIALANLKSYRLESGLEELHLALMIAREQGQESAFMRVLKGRDPSGLLAKAMCGQPTRLS